MGAERRESIDQLRLEKTTGNGGGSIETKSGVNRIGELISRYQQEVEVGRSDYPLLKTLMQNIGDMDLRGGNSHWADAWIHEMKVKQKISSGTIRHSESGRWVAPYGFRCIPRLMCSSPQPHPGRCELGAG